MLLNLYRFIVERSQVFNLRTAENNRSSAAPFGAFYQKKIADRNVCSRLLNLVTLASVYSRIKKILYEILYNVGGQTRAFTRALVPFSGIDLFFFHSQIITWITSQLRASSLFVIH